jgi:general secretion pathway protein I
MTRRGFSLLEVLIALAVLAIALGAVVRSAGQQVQLLDQARSHAYAQWVAANVLAEARLARQLPASGVQEGEAMMGGQRWHWRLQIAPTPVGGISRLDVSVAPAHDEAAVVLTLSGFSRSGG